MRRLAFGAVASALFTFAGATAQSTSDGPLASPSNGMRRVEAGWQAFTNATVHVSPDKVLTGATLIVREGKILAILERGADGSAPRVPMGPVVRDCTGLHIYAGFIEPFLEVPTPLPDVNAPGAHWNTRVTPQRRVIDGAGPAERDLEGLRSLGFVAAAMSPTNGAARSGGETETEEGAPLPSRPGGIFRGSGVVASLAKRPATWSAARPTVYRSTLGDVEAGAFHVVGFELSTGSPEPDRWPGYPSSEMGAIALVRQVLSDVDWIESTREAGYDVAPGAIDALMLRSAPLYFDVQDELELLRAVKVAKEFRRPAIVRGSGLEFRRLDAIVESVRASDEGVAPVHLVLPLAFPNAPRVGTFGAANSVSLRDLMTWEQAPSNPRRVRDAIAADVGPGPQRSRVALTTSELRQRSQFRGNLEKAMRFGLSGRDALAMLTTEPAAMLGVESSLGTIEVGKAASFVIASGDLFRITLEPTGKSESAEKPTEKSTEKASDKTDEKTDPKPDPKPDETADAGRTDRASSQPPLAPEAKTAPEAGNAPREGETRDTKAERPRRAEIREVVIDGVRHVVSGAGAEALAGVWDVTLDRPAGAAKDGEVRFEFSSRGDLTVIKDFIDAEGKPALDDKGKARSASVKPKGVVYDARRLDFSFEHKPFGAEGVFTVSATANVAQDALEGVLRTADGSVWRWRATKRDAGAPATAAAPARRRPVGVFVVREIDAKAEQGAEHLRGRMLLKKDGTIVVKHGPMVLKPKEQKVLVENDKVSVSYTLDMAQIGRSGEVKVSGEIRGEAGDEVFAGSMVVPDGVMHTFTMSRAAGDPDVLADLPESLGYPFGAYGREDRNAFAGAPGVVVLRNATLWTGGASGVVRGGYVVLRDGVIDAVGEGEAPAIEGARIIDATGKHVTPGIIDCHSHTGISRGVNEGGQAVTSEVRIQDVTDPDAISWYRQLAGGVTTVNSLHGSANAIGGQNAVNKNRWGATHPEDLHFVGRGTYDDSNPYAAGASMGSDRYPVPPGVKWALGENPRQINWGERFRQRYPQTRMGVETIIRDRLIAAREYHQRWKDWNAGKFKDDKSVLPPRRDLELEAIAEVLDGSRWVHCHSYRQDEILMLARVAKEFGFKIGTYQHILEGYKVATDVRDSARGASAFSDWWNFKVEVQDAIPQGPTLMHQVGVVVSYNSDSDELARRLNTEAAKAVKYGGLDPQEAFKFVTLNPAIQLGIERFVGTLEKGKQADVVLWSGDPLSTATRAERTFVDGRELFSLELDAALRAQNRAHRERIVQKLQKQGGPAPTDSEGTASVEDDGFSESARAERERMYLDRINRGLPADAGVPGDCGCGLLHW